MSGRQRLKDKRAHERAQWNGKPIRMEVVTPKAGDVRRTRWAWLGWGPQGCLIVIGGDPDAGKGIVISWVLAALTRGDLPGDLQGKPVNVLWVGTEDSWNEQVLPRLLAAGADTTRLRNLKVKLGDIFTVERDLAGLASLIREHDIKAVAFEAIADHIQADDKDNQETRHALGLLLGLAREQGLTMLITTHLNKMTGRTFGERLLSSRAYSAVPRAGWLVGKHPEKPDSDGDPVRVLAFAKGNLGRVPPNLLFRIEGTVVANGDPNDREDLDIGRLVVVGSDDVTAQDVLDGPQRRTKEDEVADFLEALLKDGPVAAKDVEAAAEQAGLAWRTVKRHKKAAGVESKNLPDGSWAWFLDAEDGS